MAKGSEPQLYKRQLQEYTQKYGLPFPEYRTQNKGFPHAPQFRACVLVDGQLYESLGTFPHRKEAEKDAARVALQRITVTVKNLGVSTLQDPSYLKMILNEYAAKMNLKKPEYTTTPINEAHLVFISSVVFNGQVYIGEVGGSKKMAEQLAARAAIQSLLEYDSGVLRQIVHSKVKIHDRIFKLEELGLDFQIPVNSEVPVNHFETTIVTSPSNSDMKSSSANSSGENRSKRETENSAKKKMF